LLLIPNSTDRRTSTSAATSTTAANPEGAVSEQRNALSEAQASNVDRAGAAATRTEAAGADFVGGAIRSGTDQFTRHVQAVDFPKFVSGLIENVFQAIVDSSIKQMRAYGELVANVAKTVDQFAADNISENNARDWMVSRFPDKLGIETTQVSSEQAEGDPAPPPPAQARLVTRGDNPEQALAEIAKEISMPKPPSDLSDEASEAEPVRRAKLHIARGRQQLLASMVLLGINRIVVTDGVINAKVIFDMRGQRSTHANGQGIAAGQRRGEEQDLRVTQLRRLAQSDQLQREHRSGH
jgi:hypothetical protein